MAASPHLKQNSRIFQVYNIYRIILSLILLLTFLTSANTTELGDHNPDLFLSISLFYCFFSLTAGLTLNPQKFYVRHQGLLSALLITDILILTLLTYSGGGITSGLGLLLMIPIAAGGILITGRGSTFLAAIASIAIIYSEVYLSIIRPAPDSQYIQSGLLGALFFATSLYLQSLSERMRKSDALAQQQATSITDLEQLNHLVIQRLRTGIIVVDTSNRVLTSNTAARTLLEITFDQEVPGEISLTASSDSNTRLPAELERQLNLWRQDALIRLPTFKVSQTGPQLQASFAFMNPATGSNVLIFIEDNSHFLQRARQFKLASLGRLTANIAHEIRNPLGAISHATQLLQESEKLPEEDQRMLAIILNHSKRVNLIIEDILEMSRHREHKSEIITLESWLQKFIANYQSSHAVNGEILLCNHCENTAVRVITSQLEQVATNLFENGLRYSQQATGKASLQVETGTLGDEANECPFIHFIDEGYGVSPEQEEHLFEPFHTTEPSGTGLGLYISRELCEANQARLVYRRTDSGKSCFSIFFSHPNRNMT